MKKEREVSRLANNSAVVCKLRPPGTQQETIGASKENLEEYLMCGVLRLESSEEEARLKDIKKREKAAGGGGKQLEDRRRR